MKRRIFSLLIVSVFTAICFVVVRTTHLTPAALASVSQQDIAKPCLVTKPPAQPFVPPRPYWKNHNPDQFWYGTESLWTLLGAEGTWHIGNNVLESGGRYRDKLIYWRRGFDFRKDRPALIVNAMRLDREAPPVSAGRPSAVFVTGPAPAAMMTMIDIPASGCWEITAKYHDQNLSFVVSVQP